MLPRRYMFIVRRVIIKAQVYLYRLFYINTLFIQSRGKAVRMLCIICQMQMMASINGWVKPFSVCMQLPNHFDRAYVNCKWRDHVGRCSIQDGQTDNADECNSSDDDRLGRDLEAGPVGSDGQHIQELPVTISSVDNLIIF